MARRPSITSRIEKRSAHDTFAEPPARNASLIGVGIFSHSGEFTVRATDLRVPCRIYALECTRTFRTSRRDVIGLLGRGWGLAYDEYVQSDGRVLYHHAGDGLVSAYYARSNGRVYEGGAGVYATMERRPRTLVLRQPGGQTSTFILRGDRFELTNVSDVNRNQLSVVRSIDTLTVQDDFSRALTYRLVDGRVAQLVDHRGLIWSFAYDDADRLIEVRSPASPAFPNGVACAYRYDSRHRLVTMISRRGTVALTNWYDDGDRVVKQQQGNTTLSIRYTPSGITTTVRGNGAREERSERSCDPAPPICLGGQPRRCRQQEGHDCDRYHLAVQSRR